MDVLVHAATARGVAESLAMPIPDVRAPRVAVVVGCYNQAAYVEAALRSVAAQSYREFECVVLDDGSTDGSRERIEQFLQSLADPRFRAIPRRVNGGQMAAMLEGLDATSGPFVAFLDADDLWHPEFLERHVSAHMSERGAAAMSCSNLALIDAEGTQLSGGKPNFMDGDPRNANRKFVLTEEDAGEEIRVFVAPSNEPLGWIWSATSAMMFRRTVLDTLRPSRPERLRISADSYLAKGAHVLGGTVRIERSLGCYRLHGENAFSRNPLYGSRTSLGQTSDAILAASNVELIRCLCDNAAPLVATLPRQYLANLLVALAGRKGADALATINSSARLILSALPPEPRVKPRKSLKRRLKDWLRYPFGKSQK
jgi:glycosyltransferase involved in cell wall biosynthesis